MSASTTILIVDDSITARKWTQSILSELKPDWKTIEAKSGDDALSVIQGESIDAMLLDLNMPGMDGFALSVKLRVLFPEADMAVLTANIQERSRKRAAELGLEFIARSARQLREARQ